MLELWHRTFADATRARGDSAARVETRGTQDPQPVAAG